MKSGSTDTAEKAEDVGDIKAKQSDRAIFIAWRRGKSLKQISREADLAIGTVARRLKRIQKSKVKPGG